MVRPFTLRDMTLVRRLTDHGISLHAESALADNLHPLRGALLNLVVGGDFPTFVWKSGESDQSGFIQLLLEEDRHHAHILFLSPPVTHVASNNEDGASLHNEDAVNGQAWLPLLDQAVIEAGQHGAHSVVAEVDEVGPELPVLRRAGFAVYTRQDIWMLEDFDSTALAYNERAMALEPRRSSDDWDIQLLYANTVPRMVQLVEPLPPLNDGESWILRDEQGELAAYVQIHEGPLATWLRFFIHPSAEAEAEGILLAALRAMGPRAKRPVYCCVRRYEGWLPTALERNGFVMWASQAVMVKHTVHHTPKALPKLATALEGHGVPISAPYVQRLPAADVELERLPQRVKSL